VRSQQPGRSKPLHPLIWGCLGCSVVVLAAVILGAVGVRVAIREISAAQEVKRKAGMAEALRRVPGGVLRCNLMAEGCMELEALAWRDNDRLTYMAMKMPSIAEMMAMSQPGMVVPFWDEEKMKKHSIEMAAIFLNNPIRQYDFGRAAETAVVDMPENTVTEGCGGPAWSPQGDKVVVGLVPVDMVLEMADTDVEATLYLGSPGDAEEWIKLGPGSWPEWSPDGRWITYRRAEENKRQARYLVAADGAGNRRLTEAAYHIWGWEMAAGVCTGVYLRIGVEDDSRPFPWEVRYVRLADGESKRISLHGKVQKLGPLSPVERGFTKRWKNDKGEVFTRIGAVELASGRVRWLRRDLPGAWGCTGEILGGRAVVLVPCDGPKIAGASASSDFEPDFDPDTECAGPGVLSARDGQFREIPGLAESHKISPAGNRIAWAAQTEGTLYGMIPVPVEAMAVLDIIYPEELLTDRIE